MHVIEMTGGKFNRKLENPIINLCNKQMRICHKDR